MHAIAPHLAAKWQKTIMYILAILKLKTSARMSKKIIHPDKEEGSQLICCIVYMPVWHTKLWNPVSNKTVSNTIKYIISNQTTCYLVNC